LRYLSTEIHFVTLEKIHVLDRHKLCKVSGKNFNLPRTLIIFESAARLGSFTRAAEELAIQQPSVSAAIRQLEDTLGTVLFVRAHRNVTLTAAGARLFAGVSRSLSGLEAAITATQELGRNLHVTLSTSSAFSYYWMMPRLSAFHTIHPDIDLRLQTSDRDVDLNIENISLGIRVGKWQLGRTCCGKDRG
jgi:DNA-binding transcriptional LysR family regulator